MDSAYEYALRRRELLRHELDKVENFLALHAEFTAKNAQPPLGEHDPNVGEVSEDRAVDVERALAAVPEAPQSAGRVMDNPKPSEVIEQVREILKARGQPLTRRQIFDALEAKGVRIRGIEPLKVLGTTLWRAKEDFHQIEGRGYWLVGEPVPIRRLPVRLSLGNVKIVEARRRDT